MGAKGITHYTEPHAQFLSINLFHKKYNILCTTHCLYGKIIKGAEQSTGTKKYKKKDAVAITKHSILCLNLTDREGYVGHGLHVYTNLKVTKLLHQSCFLQTNSASYYFTPHSIHPEHFEHTPLTLNLHNIERFCLLLPQYYISAPYI